MNTSKAFLMIIDRHELGVGLPTEIIGVYWERENGGAGFRIKFLSGLEKSVPVEGKNYILLSEDDVRAGRIPEVFD